MTEPNETAELVTELTREYREHAAKPAEHLAGAQAADDVGDVGEDPDCE